MKEKRVKSDKKSNKKIIIIIASIIALLIIIGIILYIKKDAIFSGTKYVETKNRKSYIIENVDDTLLAKYLSKKERTMVIVMATWCSHCQDEAPDLNKLITEFKDYNIIVVSQDEDVEEMKKFLRDNNFNWFVIFDKDKKIRTSIDPTVTTVPYMALFDVNGNVVSTHKGQFNYDGFYNFFNEL